MWWDVPVSNTNIQSWMGHKFGASIVTDYVSHNLHNQIDTTSLDSMLEGLALTHLYFGMRRQSHGPIELILDELEELVDAYSPDCFIFSRHLGCKHNYAAHKIIRDFCKKIGLPSLFLTSDIFDIREVSENKIRSEIETFFRQRGLA